MIQVKGRAMINPDGSAGRIDLHVVTPEVMRVVVPGTEKPPTFEEVHAKIISKEILVHQTRNPIRRDDIQVMISNIQKKCKLAVRRSR